METNLDKKSVSSLMNKYLYKELPKELYKEVPEESYSVIPEELKMVDLETLNNSLQEKIMTTKLPNNTQKVVFGKIIFVFSNEKKTKILFNPDTVFFGKIVTRNDVLQIIMLLLKNFGIKIEFEELQKIFNNKVTLKNSKQKIIDYTNIINMLKMALENNKKYMVEGGTRKRRKSKYKFKSKSKSKSKKRTKHNKNIFRKKKNKLVGGDSTRKFLFILLIILFNGTIASSINYGVNPTLYNGNIFLYFSLGTLFTLMALCTNCVYSLDLEDTHTYREQDNQDMDSSTGSTETNTSLGDYDLEDPTDPAQIIVSENPGNIENITQNIHNVVYSNLEESSREDELGNP